MQSSDLDLMQILFYSQDCVLSFQLVSILPPYARLHSRRAEWPCLAVT